MKLPRTIEGYEFVERLGAGAFGAVYRATVRGEIGFEQDVAIKVLAADRVRYDADSIAALANEARILSRVQHPNIVQARHFIRISDEALGDTWALVLELVRGQTLRRWMDWDKVSARPLPITAPLLVMSEVSDGLHFAHRLLADDGKPLGLVHRDLKPENLVVTNEGRLKILDFNIAWAKHRLGRDTDAGFAKGTPRYMSPEQLRGEATDGRSDLYALGEIAFEMLTGEPYVLLQPDVSPLRSALEVRWSERAGVLRDALYRRYDQDADGPAGRELISIVESMLRPDPTTRPAEGGEVFDRLEDLVQLHRPSRGRGHLRRWVQWRREQDARGETEALGHVAHTVLLDSIHEHHPTERIAAPAAETDPAAPPVAPPEGAEASDRPGLPEPGTPAPPAPDPSPGRPASRWWLLALAANLIAWLAWWASG